MKEKIEKILSECNVETPHKVALVARLEDLLKEQRNCTACKAPFEPHHHQHIARKGIYHTNCYKK